MSINTPHFLRTRSCLRDKTKSLLFLRQTSTSLPEDVPLPIWQKLAYRPTWSCKRYNLRWDNADH
eukprot:1262560-Amphidinium_carterae.2